MSESRRQGNIIFVSVVVLVLFAISSLTAGPAAGAVVASSDLEITTSQPDPDPDPSPDKGVLVASGDLAVKGDDGWELVARPIEPARTFTLGGGRMQGFFNNCFIDFNETSVLQTLPDHAIDSFVVWPFWNQYCPVGSDHAVAVQPIGSSHYHLGYEDTSIVLCPDLGHFGRPIEPGNVAAGCNPIDPLTEPRSGVQPHSEDYSIRILAHDIGTDERLKFDLNQIRILSGQAEICFVKTDLPWIAAEPTDDPPGYCGDLGPGNWDISESIIDAHEVRIYARSPNMSFTDLGIKVN